ncbi:MAG: thrombospondin type 3 repeat-containing protein [Candidatus Buchananbacteria bacterium]
MLDNTSQMNTNSQGGVSPETARQSEDVYVMPEKFQPKMKRSSSGLLISVIVLIIVLVGIGAYFAYGYLSKNKIVNEPDQNNNAALDFGDENQIVVTSTDELASSTGDLATSTATSSEPVVETNTSTPAISLTPPQLSPDTDNDNLTDLEESLIGTSLINSDTDNDGFKDGDEIVNGYNPLIPESVNSAKLESASFIKMGKTDFASDNFSVPVIKRWSFSTIKATKQVIITTDTGEIIKISVRDNPSRVSALDWYLALNPQVSPMQLRQIEYGDLTGIVSPDGLSTYLTDILKTRIYSFEYIMDNGSQVRYPNIFKMLIKKFTLIAGGAITSTSSATSTGTGL